MAREQRWTALGRWIAPPRFLLFALVFAAAGAMLFDVAGRSRAIMGGFDLAALAFILSVVPLFRHGDAARMRHTAATNDANRELLLGLTSAVMLVILVTVHDELGGVTDTSAGLLVIVTLALAWLFANLVFALHYAHLYYLPGQTGDTRGLGFPDTKEPDYGDFLYFSYTLGMTFQTSDVTVASRAMRRVVLAQSMAGFVFNLGVIAFSINVLGGR